MGRGGKKGSGTKGMIGYSGLVSIVWISRSLYSHVQSIPVTVNMSTLRLASEVKWCLYQRCIHQYHTCYSRIILMVYNKICDVIVDVVIGDDDNDSTSIVHSLM